MTRHANRDAREPKEFARRPDPNPRACQPPAFKPVALPALAAAVRSAKVQSSRKSADEFDAILRKFETQD